MNGNWIYISTGRYSKKVTKIKKPITQVFTYKCRVCSIVFEEKYGITICPNGHSDLIKLDEITGWEIEE